MFKLTPFVELLLAGDALRFASNPAELSSLSFELYQRQKASLVWLKDDKSSGQVSERFRQFVQQTRTGFSPLTADDGVDILEASNRFLGMTEEMDASGRDIGTHFRMSSSFSRKGRILYNAVKIFRPRVALEVGTAYGMSARFMLNSAQRYMPGCMLHTIEAGEPQFSLAEKTLTERFGQHIQCHKGLSTTVIPEIITSCGPVDLVFHDGAHDGKIYKEDFRNLLPALRPGSVVLFDDIHWFDKRFVREDPKCYQGWRSIVSNPAVSCAVEIDRDMGAVLIGS